MNATRRQNLVIHGLLLLILTVQTLGQNCFLDSVCSALSLPKQSKLMLALCSFYIAFKPLCFFCSSSIHWFLWPIRSHLYLLSLESFDKFCVTNHMDVFSWYNSSTSRTRCEFRSQAQPWQVHFGYQQHVQWTGGNLLLQSPVQRWQDVFCTRCRMCFCGRWDFYFLPCFNDGSEEVHLLAQLSSQL